MTRRKSIDGVTDVSISTDESKPVLSAGLKTPAPPASGGGPRNEAGWVSSALEIFRKDIRVELRTRYALGSVALFSVTTMVMVSAAVSGTPLRSEIKAALIWIVLLFAGLSGLARAFVREEEAGTAQMLRLTAPGTAVYAGKLLFNLTLVFAVEAITLPLFAVLMPEAHVRYDLFIPTLLAGGWGLAATTTFIAAMIAQASSGKSALFAIVSFPVLMPLLLWAVQGTAGAFSNVATFEARSLVDIGQLSIYGVVMTIASFLLFEYVWHD